MADSEFFALRALRANLIRAEGPVKAPRAAPERSELRRRLDERLLAFRIARKAETADAKGGAETRSWLRAVRQAVGVPVDELAQRLGVSKYEVFRVEKAEGESRIVLATLRRAADALGCDVVYAVTPRGGSLEDLATRQREAWEMARAEAQLEEARRTEGIEGKIGWRAVLRKYVRKEFRKRGVRVR